LNWIGSVLMYHVSLPAYPTVAGRAVLTGCPLYVVSPVAGLYCTVTLVSCPFCTTQ
jgi:hypothetical protein